MQLSCNVVFLTALVLASIISPVEAAYVKEFVTRQDFASGSHERTGFIPELGGLALPDLIDLVPIVWVPSPNVNIVLKLDGRTGRQLGAYRMGPPRSEWRPCAVAADPAGNVYVACSSPGRLGKIVQIRPVPIGDVNGDGMVKTSRDADGNGSISLNEILDWGSDDCIGKVIDVGVGTEPSSLVFDNDGQLWVALEGQSAIARVDLVAGIVGSHIHTPGRPSALLVNGANSILVLSRKDRILSRVSTVTYEVEATYDLGDSSPAAMCVDHYGRVWIADEYGGLIMVHPADGSKIRYASDYCGGFAGVAVDRDNSSIWASCPVKGLVTHFSPVDGSIIGEVPVGALPGQLCFDTDGYLWVINEDGDTASRVDVVSHKVVATAPTFPAPHSNSAFVSSLYVRGVPSSGAWSVLVDSGLTGTPWGLVTWEADTNGGALQVEACVADTPGELPFMPRVTVRNGEGVDIGNGRYMLLRVTLLRGGSGSPVIKRFRVESNNRPPDVSVAFADLDIDKLQSGSYWPVVIKGVVDLDGDPVSITITNVVFERINGVKTGTTNGANVLGIGGSIVWLPKTSDADQGEWVISFVAIDSQGAESAGTVRFGYISDKSASFSSIPHQ
ncbi:MAG: Vgb family protein [Armatimonadota bacterium]